MTTSASARVLGGVIVPAVSNFDTWQGALSAEPFKANLRAHVASGAEGVLVAGSLGEAVLLTEEERARLTGWAREVIPADRWLIVGTSAESTALTIQRTQAACLRGADAVLVMPPSYYGAAMTRAAIADHYWRIVDESACGVVLYNAPRYTHHSMGVELAHALAAHGNVIGLLDGSSDRKRLGAFLEAQSPTFSVLTTHGAAFADALLRGARGGAIGAATFAADLAMTVARAVRAGDNATAREAQGRLTLLSERVAMHGPAGVKAALDAVGLHGGPVRSPLAPLSAAQRADVLACLRETRIAPRTVAR
jgi:4-hydroxy-2-oxoglutarate aldolase